MVQGEGFEGKYVVVETCDSTDKTQQGWSYDAGSSTVKGPGGLCLDNRTASYKGASIPQQENGQMQLRPCDGSAFQQFELNTTAVPPPPPGAPTRPSGTAGVLQVSQTESGRLKSLLSVASKRGVTMQSNNVPVGNSSRQMPGACSHGVGLTGPCCIKPNGWWDWNLGPVSCDAGTDELMIFTGTQVQMIADDKSTTKRCWSVWDYPVGGYEVQYWAKPLPQGAAALYILNTNTTHEKPVSIQLSKVFGLSGTVAVRDVWRHSDNGTASGTFASTVGPADSLFVTLTPKASTGRQRLKTDAMRLVSNAPAAPGLPPDTPGSGWTRNIVLCYLDGRSTPLRGSAPDPDYTWTASMFRSLLAYESRNGSLVDTLGFDTFLLTGNYWVGGKSLYPISNQKPTLQSDWLTYLKMQLDQGARNLEAAAADVRTALPLAAFRPKVILMIPYPWAVDWPNGESWGKVDGRALHFGTQADRVAAVNWFVETAVSEWKARGFSEVLLSGFYWLEEALGTVKNLEDEDLLPQVSRHIHAQPGDLRFFWCPYNASTSPGHKNWTDWAALGFDVATLQPGFIHDGVTVDRFRVVDDATRRLGMGVEMEVPLSVKNTAVDLSWQKSFAAYESASKTYRYDTSVRMWYYGNEVK